MKIALLAFAGQSSSASETSRTRASSRHAEVHRTSAFRVARANVGIRKKECGKYKTDSWTNCQGESEMLALI